MRQTTLAIASLAALGFASRPDASFVSMGAPSETMLTLTTGVVLFLLAMAARRAPTRG